MQDYLNNSKTLNEMPLHERMEYQRIHDRKVILEASMQGVRAELKMISNKRKHPFALENIQND